MLPVLKVLPTLLYTPLMLTLLLLMPSGMPLMVNSTALLLN
jgi:hypothetical protein